MYLTSRSAFQVASVGLIWVVNAVTHSALDIAIVGIANTVSTVIVTLPAGVWVDRVNRLVLLLISNVVSVVCLALLILATSSFDLIFIAGLVIVWAAAGELYRSTSYAVLPDIVHVDQLVSANAVSQSGFQIVSSISTVLGGILIVAIGVALTFVYGVAGYGMAALFSAFLVFRFRRKSSENKSSTTPAKGRNMIREIKEGFSWLLTQRGLLGLSLIALVSNFLFGIPTYFLVIYVTEILKVGAVVYAGILAIFVAGSAAGSLIAGRFPGALKYAGKINILVWGASVGAMLLVLGLVPETIVAFVACLGIGLGFGFGNNVWLTSAQNIVPIEMRGRYFAIDGLLSFIGGPPSIAVGGILITLIGISKVFLLSGILLLISALVFSFMRSLWNLDGRYIPHHGQ
jgi:MFS family permease